MRINNNLMAMNTHRQLGINASAGSKSIEKLSSGYRINRAGDDAAGLAISEKMRGQIRGLNQASRNSQDAISLIQTAEGALNETHAILQRMRELGVQAANDTNTGIDRGEIQKEIDQLTSEIDRIGNTTEFNTKSLLNGGAGLQVDFTAKTVNSVSQDWISVTGGTAETKSTGTVAITAATKATGATTGNITVAATLGAKTFEINGYTLSYTATGTAATDAGVLRDLINANGDKLGVVATGTDATLNVTSTSVGTASELTMTSAAGAIIGFAQSVSAKGSDATITSAAIGAATNMVSRGNTISVIGGDYKGMEIQLNGNVMSDTGAQNAASFDVKGNGVLGMQIGANEGQMMSISISDMRSSALGVNSINVTNSTTAGAAITTINTALERVSGERSKLGAAQNRLEHTIKNLDTSSENLQASESRIRDVDMAKEMMEFTKNNILQQAAQAMLAQANQAPQGVLQLLR